MKSKKMFKAKHDIVQTILLMKLFLWQKQYVSITYQEQKNIL